MCPWHCPLCEVERTVRPIRYIADPHPSSRLNQEGFLHRNGATGASLPVTHGTRVTRDARLGTSESEVQYRKFRFGTCLFMLQGNVSRLTPGRVSLHVGKVTDLFPFYSTYFFAWDARISVLFPAYRMRGSAPLSW